MGRLWLWGLGGEEGYDCFFLCVIVFLGGVNI